MCIRDSVIAGFPSDGQLFLEDVEDELISIIQVEGQLRHAGRAESTKGSRE